MVWDKNQGTPLHDHGGLWVVECLYKGQMQVINFEYLGEKDGLHQFNPTTREQPVAGDTEFRIPPMEHHVVRNGLDTPSVTIHVFGGILEHCNIFEPVEGGYRKVAKTMAYTE
jgi:predicted metal-dependent enzyme (double-stranded beta helix superfamily)